MCLVVPVFDAARCDIQRKVRAIFRPEAVLGHCSLSVKFVAQLQNSGLLKVKD